jgi:hypothetical protein
MQALRRPLEVQQRSQTEDRQSIRWDHEIGSKRFVFVRQQGTFRNAVAFDDDLAFSSLK